MDDKISVRSYKRGKGKPKARKPEKEDGTGVEVRAIAPTEGKQIVTSGSESKKRPHLNPRSPGVQVLGGGGATKDGVRKGVTRLGG